MTTRARRTATALLATGLLAAGGCAPGATIQPGAWSDPLAVVTAAAEGLQDGFSFIGRISYDGGDEKYTGEDIPGDDAFRVRLADFGQGVYEARFLGDDMYLRYLTSGSGLPEGWGHFSPRLGKLMRGALNGWTPPSEMVPALLAEAGDLESAGGGFFEGVVDFGDVDSELSGIGALAEAADNGDAALWAALDADGVLTSFGYTVHVTGVGDVEVKYDFSDHGEPDPVEAPDSDDVTEVTSDNVSEWLGL